MKPVKQTTLVQDVETLEKLLRSYHHGRIGMMIDEWMADVLQEVLDVLTPDLASDLQGAADHYSHKGRGLGEPMVDPDGLKKYLARAERLRALADAVTKNR